MSVEVTTEPTADQVAIIGALEHRAAAAYAEMRAIADQLQHLRAQGIEAANEFDFGDDEKCDLENLRSLRVTGGRLGFFDWFRERARDLEGVSQFIEDRDSDAHDRYRLLIAVEAKVAEVAPGLIDLVNRGGRANHVDAYHHFTDELEKLTGFTREGIQDQAEVVITQLIESGWRP